MKLREVVVVLGSALTLLIGLALSGDADEPSEPPLPRYPVGEVDPISDGSYEWRTVPIGAGGFVTGLVAAAGAEGSAMYARTDVGGAYRWHEDAETWEQMLRTDRMTAGTLEASDYTVASIAVGPDPSMVAIASGYDFNPSPEEVEEGAELSTTGRVLVSTDGGRAWAASEQRWFVAGNQDHRVGSERLVIDPTDPTRLYLGTQREGFWWSQDSGANWSQVAESVLPFGQEGDPTADQAGVNLVAVMAGENGGDPVLIAGVTAAGIYRSTDRGVTWDQVQPLHSGEIPVSPTHVGEGLLVTIHTPGRDEARLLRLDEGATRVTDLNLPTATAQLITAADPANPDHLVATDEAVRSRHLWTSTDGGRSWRAHRIAIDATSIPWLAHTDLTDYMTTGRLMYDPNVEGRVWFAEGMAIWRTDDLSADTVVWTATSGGIEETVVSGIVVPPGGSTFVTVADRQGFRFDDLDHRPNSPLVDSRFASGSSLDHSGQNPEVLAWVGAESNLPSEAQPRGAVSVDGGDTWREMGGLDRSMYGGEVAVSATAPDTIVWLPTHRTLQGRTEDQLGLFRSSDGGQSWTHISPDGEFDSFHRFFWWFARRALAADRVDGRFYLMADEERFYTSHDGGSSWTRAPHSPPCTTATDCHVFGQVQAEPDRAGHLWASTGTGGLWRTVDSGATEWQRVDGVDEARSFSFGAPIGDADRPTVFVHGRVDGDERLGVWRSTDDGQTWLLLSHSPNSMAMEINAIAGDPDVPGRVLVGFAGAGATVGDDPSLR